MTESLAAFEFFNNEIPMMKIMSDGRFLINGEEVVTNEEVRDTLVKWCKLYMAFNGKYLPIFEELDRATNKFPAWPTDPLHALAVVTEESGELNKEILQMIYEPHKTNFDEVRKEAVQMAAMALRFYLSLGEYRYTPSTQHVQ